MGIRYSELITWPLSEIDGYRLYERLEPFGVWRDNLHSAQITSAIYNVNRKERTKPSTPSDFMFDFTPKEVKPEPEQSPEDILNHLNHLNRLANISQKL